MILNDLSVQMPKFLADNTMYLTMAGSHAYGTNTENSDIDLVGFCIPPKSYVFPYAKDYIHGFGTKPPSFEQFRAEHVIHKEKEYDITVYSIVKFFQLAMENNPNVIELLFTPQNCIIHSTMLAEEVRRQRHIFLHKGVYHKMVAYARSQLSKCLLKSPENGSKRKELVDRYGFDVKFCTHIVRLLSQCEQILVEFDLDLQEKSRTIYMRQIRNGEVSFEEIQDYFNRKIQTLESLYTNSKLRERPDEAAIKQLLLNCLEIHYRGIPEFSTSDKYERFINELNLLMEKNNVTK